MVPLLPFTYWYSVVADDVTVNIFVDNVPPPRLKSPNRVSSVSWGTKLLGIRAGQFSPPAAGRPDGSSG